MGGSGTHLATIDYHNIAIIWLRISNISSGINRQSAALETRLASKSGVQQILLAH